MPRKKNKTITLEDRHIIERAYMTEGKSPREIADDLGLAHSTVYHEISRGYTGTESKGRPDYSAAIAQASLCRRGRPFTR